MTHYPDIQRHDGALFFSVAENDRGAIATSIERLIDLLDQMEGDPDLEPWLAGYDRSNDDDREGDLDARGYPDLSEGDDQCDDEPMLGAPERHPTPWGHGREHSPNDTQTAWAQGEPDDRELENEHAGDILDEPHDEEPDLEADPVEENGDEGDWSSVECWNGPWTGDRSGDRIAADMIRGLPIAARRAAAYSTLGPLPIVYRFGEAYTLDRAR